MADLATLRIVVDASGAIRVVDQFGNATSQAAQQATQLEKAAKRASAVVGGALVAGLALAVKETVDAQREQAQLAAVLRSTAGASGQTLDSLNAQAESLRKLTAATGGEIAEAQALLLTFTKIGGETFPRATAAVLDMAQALGTDARSAALQLGKALNDPVLGVTALGRAGVQFNDQQKAVIASLVETNRLAEAQAIILRELETQVGGSAAAYRNTLGGALTAVRESFVELLELGNGPRMQGFIENINILADSMGIFATQSELAFTRSNLAIRRNEARAGGFLMGLTGGKFGAGIAGGAGADVARYENDIIALETLLEEQRRGVLDGIIGRASARGRGGALGVGATGGGTGIGVPRADFDASLQAAEFAALVGDALRLADAERRLQAERTNAQARQALLTGEFAEQIGEGAREVLNFGQVIGKLPGQVSESQRVLTEQLQLASAGFARSVLDGGLTNLPRLWDSFVGLGKDAISQVFAKEFMDRIGNRLAERLSTAFDGMGLGGLAFGGLLTGFAAALLDAGNAARRMQAQIDATNRAIRDFGQRPYDTQLTEEQRRLADAQDERDTLVRRALADRGLSGLFDGDLDGTRARLEQRLAILTDRNFPQTAATRAIAKDIAETLAQLAAIDKAYEDNAKAIEKSIKVLEEQTRAEEAATRARQAASLTAFADSLRLGPQSPLSPTAQLAEARRQYDAVLALAQGGDASAIDSLPATARTLLDASRAVFASGVRYADEFARVQQDVAGLVGDLTAPRDAAEVVKDRLYEVRDGIVEMQDALVAEQQAQLAVQQEGFTRLVERLDATVTRLDTIDRTLRDGGALRPSAT